MHDCRRHPVLNVRIADRLIGSAIAELGTIRPFSTSSWNVGKPADAVTRWRSDEWPESTPFPDAGRALSNDQSWPQEAQTQSALSHREDTADICLRNIYWAAFAPELPLASYGGWTPGVFRVNTAHNKCTGRYVMRSAVVVSTARTPIGRAYRGAFNNTQSQALGGHVIAEAVKRASLAPAEIDDVVIGAALQQGAQGFNLARQCALAAGLPDSVAGMTVDRQCSSGLMAIATAAKQIVDDGMEITVGGGLELDLAGAERACEPPSRQGSNAC